MSARHDCSRCYRAIPTGQEVERFGILYHPRCAPALPERRPAVAVAARRWSLEVEGGRLRWWYTVLVEGGRGALYEVELLWAEGRERPLPFKVTRSGRTTRTLGRGASGELRSALEQAAVAALTGA